MLRRTLVWLVKQLIWGLRRHDGATSNPSRPVFIVTSRRSGGTWLAELIAREPGARLIGQPLSAWQLPYSLMPVRPPPARLGQFVALSQAEADQLSAFIQALLDGRIRLNEPLVPWRGEFHWRTNRTVLKITDAGAILPWIVERFEAEVVYLVRHPIPQALSCMRRNWGLTTEAYLDSREFCKSNLTEEQLTECRSIQAHGGQLDRFVLNWALENLVPLRGCLRSSRVLSLSYERLVLDPERSLDRLCDRLGLVSKQRMLSAHARPSKTSRIGRRSRVFPSETWADDPKVRVRTWRSEISEPSAERAMRVLNTLEIPVYQYDLDCSKPSYLQD